MERVRVCVLRRLPCAVTPAIFDPFSPQVLCVCWANESGGQDTRTFTFTLSNQSSATPLNWRATVTVSTGADVTKYLTPSSGTISPGGTTTASFTAAGEAGVCAPGQTLYLRFTGPSNTVTATIGC